MTKSYIRLAIFLVLMLALSLGLSYTSLHQQSQASEDKNSKKAYPMSIALVNEDEGTRFNQDKLDFGDSFVEGIDQNNPHEWHVVSRSVAESGLERNIYDMMIVIPNDFSEKSLSINSASPEQVVLNYKINASDNDSVRAQAEETASSILNEFNRRIIDVYFASVIGELQDAQNSVSEIVEENAAHTYTYNRTIHDPLSSYTDRFNAVKDSTAASKDRFSSYENIMDSYEERLRDQMDEVEAYPSSIEDTSDLIDANNVLNSDFLEELNTYHDNLSNGDVDEQLQQLQNANQYINDQLQLTTDEDSENKNNIAINAMKLRKYLHEALDTVESAQSKFNIKAIKNDVAHRLDDIVGDAFDGNDHLTNHLNTQDERIQEKIEKQIAKLPSMDKERIGNTDLSSGMITDIQNVIDVTEKYNNEFNQVPHHGSDKPISPDVKTLKEHLKDNGVRMTDTVKLPEAENPEGEFSVYDIPDGFTIDHLAIEMANGKRKDYPDYTENAKVDLPEYEQGKFTVQLNLKLTDDDVDIYEPKEWQWQVNLKDEKDTDENDADEYVHTERPNVPLLASNTVAEADDDKQDQNGDEPDNDASANDDKQRDATKSDKSTSDDNESGESGEKADDSSEDEGTNKKEYSEDEAESNNDDETSDENSNSDSKENGEREVEEVDIDHDHIRHEVTDPVIDESTQDLLHAVENTVAPYQKLLSLYEAYFGVPLSCENGDDCTNIGDNSLKEMATDDSLYTLFNKDVGERLSDYVASQVTGDVNREISKPLNTLKNRIDHYQRFIENTDQRAAELISVIAETKEAASVLNENLEETLDDITHWREKSLNLVESQTDIQKKNDDEYKAVISLKDEFQPLLAQSQTLAEKASSNLNEAEHVYQTFERIDKQADTIQESGTDLVQKAEDLSENMTDQLQDEQQFAENFSDIMPYSQIGDRQNEDLYDFLSEPVDTQNDGLIVEDSNSSTPYFLVLICFVVALFTAYVISTVNQRRQATNQFATESSLIGRNSLTTGITAGLGVLEGIVIGLVSAHFLNIGEGKLVLWTGLMTLVMLMMVLVSAYLLRQLKMIGMFILLAVMSLYLFSTESGLSGINHFQPYSPLQYVDTFFTNILADGFDNQWILFSMISLILFALLGHLLVVAPTGRHRTKDDDDAA